MWCGRVYVVIEWMFYNIYIGFIFFKCLFDFDCLIVIGWVFIGFLSDVIGLIGLFVFVCFLKNYLCFEIVFENCRIGFVDLCMKVCFWYWKIVGF